jgi:hypothetical protein
MPKLKAHKRPEIERTHSKKIQASRATKLDLLPYAYVVSTLGLDADGRFGHKFGHNFLMPSLQPHLIWISHT